MPNNKVEVEITGKATGFAAEFQKISAGAQQAAGKIRSAFSGLAGAAAALGASLTVGGFAVFIKGAIDAADKLNDLEKATGVAATTLGGIAFAAQQAGTDIDGTAKAFGKLNLYIADAQAGNEKALDTFRKLGISLADLRSNKADEIFAKLADAFSGFEDDANKAAGAALIFGKSYQSVLPLLDQGGESLRKNIAYFQRYSGVTSDLVTASDQFNDSMTKLTLLNKAFGNYLASALLPSLQSLVDKLVESKENSTLFADVADRLSGALKTIASFGIQAGIAFSFFGEALGARLAQLQALVSLDFSAVDDIGQRLEASAARTNNLLSEFRKAMSAGGVPESLKDTRGGPGTGRSGRRPTPSFGDGGGAAKKDADEFARALERVAKMAAEADLELAAMFSTQEITGAQKALAALTSSDEWKKFTEPQRQDLTNRFAAIDAIQRETIEWKKKREEHEKEIKALQDLQAEQQHAVQAFTSNLGQYADENTILERQIELVGKDDVARQKLAETIAYESLKKQALLADDQAGLAILDEQFKKRIALIEQLARATEDFARVQQINSIFIDSFADSLTAIVTGTKSVKDAFRDMERAIVAGISRIAARKLAEALFGGANGGPSIGDIFAKLLGLLSGSGGSAGGGGAFISGPQFGFAANGASFTGFRPYVVGERGPEIVMPRPGSQIVPNHMLNRIGGGTVNVTINQTVTPGVSTQSARQTAAQLREAVVRSIKER